MIFRVSCLRCCCQSCGPFLFHGCTRVPLFLPTDRFQQALLLFFFAFFAASCFNPPYLQFLLMQHVPTVLAALLLVWVSKRLEISRVSFTLIIAFLCLHTLGARYLYSYTPYDDWSETLFGVSISETFGFERNHYDRLVHFSFGLLMAYPIQELERRYFALSNLVASLLAIEFVIAMSAAYEMLEWLIAVIFAPEWSGQFLGLQGDIFDAQKDTALATLGAILTMGLTALFRKQ